MNEGEATVDLTGESPLGLTEDFEKFGEAKANRNGEDGEAENKNEEGVEGGEANAEEQSQRPSKSTLHRSASFSAFGDSNPQGLLTDVDEIRELAKKSAFLDSVSRFNKDKEVSL